ncbi:MAG: AsmA family protein [Dissulfurispiraceae bacterium]
MNTKKKVFLGLCGVVIALVLAVVVFSLTFDINSYKPRIEAVASGATGLDVKINGKMGISFFPFGISAQDIHVSNKGGDILSLEKLKIGAELIPLLKKRLNVTELELVKPVVTIVKDSKDKYNFEGTEQKSKEGRPGAAFSFNELKMSQGVLIYLDKKSGEKTELRDFNLAIKDLSIAGNVSFKGSFNCREALQRDFKIENLKATVKAVKGMFDFEPLTIGTLTYTDKKTGKKTELKEINLAINDLSVSNTSGEIIKNITFTGNLDCKEVREGGLGIDNIKSPIKAEKGVIYLRPLNMDIFGAKADADVAADMSEVNAVYKINLKISKLDFEKLEESFGTKKVIGGKGDLDASLTMKEKGSRNLMSGMDGNFSLRGNNLVIYTMDLDKILSSLEASQKFNLVDLGAFFIAGPLGTAALKGYSYGDIYNQTRGGRGLITQFVSHWKIRAGVADATDCALATHHNRIALKGKLNLVSERYDNVIVALLNDKGCAKFKQVISGPFGGPKIGAVSTVETIAGPLLSLFGKAKSLLLGGKCEVFYNGAVQQPPK